jgi:hypothetical protein
MANPQLDAAMNRRDFTSGCGDTTQRQRHEGQVWSKISGLIKFHLAASFLSTSVNIRQPPKADFGCYS